MHYERMMNKGRNPTEADIISFIGQSGLWQELRDFLDTSYDFIPEIIYYGNKYGWTMRYRKSGRTLCSLFPEKGAFTLLLVLGAKEAEKASHLIHELTPEVSQLFGDTKQLHDGRWLWIRVTSTNILRDAKNLIAIKKRPKRK